MSLRSLSKDYVDVDRPTVSQDKGKRVVVHNPHLVFQRCHIQEDRGEIRISTEGTKALEYDATALFSFSIDLRPRAAGEESDRLTVVRGDNVENGVVFTVLFVGNEGGKPHHHTAFLRRLAKSGGQL